MCSSCSVLFVALHTKTKTINTIDDNISAEKYSFSLYSRNSLHNTIHLILLSHASAYSGHPVSHWTLTRFCVKVKQCLDVSLHAGVGFHALSHASEYE